MGAWSIEPFGNDTAADWASELCQSKDLGIIESAIDRVVFRELFTRDKYLDSHDAECAVAAVAVLVALLDGPATQMNLSDPVMSWVSSTDKLPRPSKELLQKASDAIDVVLSRSSELADLWRETDDYKTWRKSTLTLKNAIPAGSSDA